MSRGQGSIFQRGEIWWIQYYSQGIRKRESSESANKTDATNLLKRRLVEAGKGQITGAALRVNHLLDNLRADYIRQRRTAFGPLMIDVHLRPHWGKYRPEQVTAAKVKAYIGARTTDGAAPATIKNEISVLRRAFSLAHEEGILGAVPYFPTPRVDNVREGFLEVEQYRRLMVEMPSYLKPVLCADYHYGLRKAKLISLRVDQVHLEQLEIRLRASTTNKKVPTVLPIYGEMVDVLTRQIEDIRRNWPHCQWLFHHCGERIRDFRAAWDSACERAGLPGLLFHDLRRSAARNMIRAGVPETVVMRVTGHKTRAMLDRYNIVSTVDLTDAGAKLEEYLGEHRKGGKVESIASGKRRAG